MGGLRRWTRSLERSARESSKGSAHIPQPDGPPVRVSGEEWLAAFSTSVQRMSNKDIPEHPVSKAAANSPDPAWHRSLIAGTHSIPGGGERVGKPYEK